MLLLQKFMYNERKAVHFCKSVNLDELPTMSELAQYISLPQYDDRR
mgnify:CR=1 FL=1